MKELSLHILDIVQNSLHAGASKISIEVCEKVKKNIFTIRINDNGKGISKELMSSLLDPFYTTKNKKTGLGIPLLKQHTEMTGGNLHIESHEGAGTTLTATFTRNHLDRQPLGDITRTVSGLIRTNPKTRIIYSHEIDKKKFLLDTQEINNELEGLPINSNDVINFIEEFIRDNLKEIST
jgi:hypothetical protein